VVGILYSAQDLLEVELPLVHARLVLERGTKALTKALGEITRPGAVQRPRKGKNGHSSHLAKAKSSGPKIVISAWDPEPYDPLEVTKCRALLLEVIRRAAHDWVLYRLSKKLHQQELAQHAYIWLFEEEPGHPWWRERHQKENRELHITSFVSICEEIDLDPEHVRETVRHLTIKDVMSAGRPAERRRRRHDSEDAHMADHGVTADVDVHTMGDSSEYESYYEAYYATPTPGLM